MKADKDKVGRYLKTAKGQIEGVLKMIEEDRYCIDVSNQLLAVEALLKKANREVLKAHMEHCVVEAVEDNKSQKIEEVLAIIDKLTK
ncbi:metal-sensing transcriptional repressor [Niameybacter massiliensis]|uniref:Metal-sensing transcriptional repressor n=1 Tax=Holtiella tumoricola TaxID=3018743 RepID=A0AA42J265_9FIRM|nr:MULTISPECIES: metal-sensing transcriptional repressor [Lachnospirales]MDA3733324.1 metal-sensing transcriptional repressor [Holtiella tumoricola]